MPRLRESLPHLAVLAVALGAAAALSTHDQTEVRQALIWLPTGVGVAGVWLLGWRAALVVAAVTAATRVGPQYVLAQTLGAACGSTAEALLGAWMLRRAGLRADFARMRDVLALFATAAVAPLASIAASALARLLGGMPVVPHPGWWESWWRMNVLGVLAIVPLALVWLAPEAAPGRLRPRAACGLVGACVLAVAGVMVFVEPGVPSILLLTMVLPLALWAAMRFGPAGAATTAAVGALTVVTLAAQGTGPFQALALDERHVAIQSLLVALVSVPLVFGALVAERQASAARWLASEGVRRALLAVLPDATYKLGADGTVLDAMVPPHESLPLPSDRLLGRRIQDLLPAELYAPHLEEIRRAARGEASRPLEYARETPDGRREREVRYVGLPTGEVLALVRDITARKLAERQLAWQARVLELVASRRSRREVFHALVGELEAMLPAAMCSILLRRGQRLFVAHAPSLPATFVRLCEGFEIGPEQAACGKSAYTNQTVVCPDIASDPAWTGYHGAAAEHGLRAAWSVPVRAADGAVLGTFAIYHRTPRTPGHDEIAIVERAAVLAGLALERELREELLASIQRNISEGLFRSQPDVGIVHANDAFARLFGYSSPEQMRALLAAGDFGNAAHRASLDRLANAEQAVQQLELELHRRDGTRFCGLVSTTIVREADGTRAACDGTVADITARKELEEHLRQAQKMEAVGQLAGGVAHDFNNLLTAIIGFAESVHGDLPADSPLRRDVREIGHAAERAAGLTRQLLAFGRRQVMSPRVVDLVAVVEQTSSMLRRLVGEHITLKLVHVHRSVSTRVDRGQMEQVLLNLVLNARDALPSGGTITIATDAVEVDAKTAAANVGQQAGPHAVLCVGDNGAGMTAEVRSRAFDPFFTTKEPGKGTGLGLSMVYGIVRQSGGSIRIDSQPGRGTTVWIWLPRVAGEVAEASPTPIPRPPAATAAGTVLVVEDEELVRNLAQRALSRAGYTVFTAADGHAALELVASRGGAIDAIVSDVVMPKMSGRELVARLRASWPDVPVLMMTGYANDGPDGLTSQGMFLQKPFTAVDLVGAVARLLAAAQQRRGAPSGPAAANGPAST